MDIIKKFKGCLIGGAAGDALGYAVEFDSLRRIRSEYGAAGITEYRLTGGKALISDDTQMSLFTADGIVTGLKNGVDIDRLADCVYLSYLDWLKTQGYKTGSRNFSLLAEVPELNHSRAPGITCLSALTSGKRGSPEHPVNDSKGCGGVMRVAPIGLFFAKKEYFDEYADMLGARVAALTHGHELGYIPAAALVHIVRRACTDNKDLKNIVADAIKATNKLFSDAEHIGYFTALMEKAVALSEMNLDDYEAIKLLGEGWVGEEALAIAVYCALKYSDDFGQAIIAAVNHDGDSDSTGAITGNICGAYLGIDGIPEKFRKNLELADLIGKIAEKLAVV